MTITKMEEITIKVIKDIDQDPYEVILQNSNGDTFTFNPQSANGEELYDFLMYPRDK